MIFLGFLIATTIVLAMSAYCAWRDFIRFGDLLAASQLLMTILGASVICRAVAPPGGFGNMIWLSAIDFGGLLLSAYWYMTRRESWGFVLCFTFIAQLCAHAGFWRAYSAGFDARYAYILCLNALAVLQLVAVGWPGARHVARDVVDVLSGRRVRGFHLGHGAPQ